MLKHFSDERQSDRENPPPSLRLPPKRTRTARLGPGVAVKIRGPQRQVHVAGVEIGPYFVAGLDWEPATACGRRFVSTPRTKTCPRGPPRLA